MANGCLIIERAWGLRAEYTSICNSTTGIHHSSFLSRCALSVEYKTLCVPMPFVVVQQRCTFCFMYFTCVVLMLKKRL